jgi:hypothetical protein
LNTDELEIIFGNAFYLKAQLNSLAYTAVEFVQGPGLRVAARKGWHRSNIVAFLVFLDDDVKIALHGDLPLDSRRPGASIVNRIVAAAKGVYRY